MGPMIRLRCPPPRVPSGTHACACATHIYPHRPPPRRPTCRTCMPDSNPCSCWPCAHSTEGVRVHCQPAKCCLARDGVQECEVTCQTECGGRLGSCGVYVPTAPPTPRTHRRCPLATCAHAQKFVHLLHAHTCLRAQVAAGRPTAHRSLQRELAS
jgi:hypothetical protein